jgi:hypothetical protein
MAPPEKWLKSDYLLQIWTHGIETGHLQQEQPLGEPRFLNYVSRGKQYTQT